MNEERVLTGVETVHAADTAQSEAAEEALIRAFWERLERFSGTLVSFNGRNFDLPVLELQASSTAAAFPATLVARPVTASLTKATTICTIF